MKAIKIIEPIKGESREQFIRRATRYPAHASADIFASVSCISMAKENILRDFENITNSLGVHDCSKEHTIEMLNKVLSVLRNSGYLAVEIEHQTWRKDRGFFGRIAYTIRQRYIIWKYTNKA